MENRMYTVGEFSRICQVSIKTLHYYDRIGLLAPLRVDPFSGYRYYGQTQIERMLLIARLKRYGFSLEDIRLFLSCTDQEALFSMLLQRRETLDLQREELDQITDELSSHLKNFERTGNIMGYQKDYEIKTTETPDRAVLSRRQMMGVKDFGDHYSALYERMARERLTPDGLRGAVYHDDQFDHECSDIELILGIQEKERADSILKGRLCAMTIHKGPYASLSDAYGALVAWIAQNGYEWDGAPYEIYTRTQFEGLEPKDWETELYFPVKKG